MKTPAGFGAALMLAGALCGVAWAAPAQPTLPEGVYRVDWNGKVRDLCVDHFTNEDLTARDWQGVLAAQGVLCTLSGVRSTRREARWRGQCEMPLMGRVARFRHEVSVRTAPDGRFDILTVISGDLSATIPIRGEALRSPDGRIRPCTREHDPFRPWQ